MNDLKCASVVTLSNPAGLYDPAPNGYSHVAIADGARRWVLVAGQGGETVDGHLSDDFQSQVRQALVNLQTALASTGARATDVAKLTVLVVDHSLERLQVFGSELERVFGSHKPACTLIPVPRLALDGMLFEIEALAALSD